MKWLETDKKIKSIVAVAAVIAFFFVNACIFFVPNVNDNKLYIWRGQHSLQWEGSNTSRQATIQLIFKHFFDLR